jgi:5-(carboxyamino)imidazole ribonucleotide mutase
MNEKIAIVLGSKSDIAHLEQGIKLLNECRIPFALEVISAHRNPDKLRDFCKKIEKKGVEVVIACAGLSAALPGFVASYVDIPVIGVPLDAGNLGGIESLLSIVEVPRGIGVVSTGIGKKGFINALLFALKILSLSSREYKKKFNTLAKKFKK